MGSGSNSCVSLLGERASANGPASTTPHRATMDASPWQALQPPNQREREHSLLYSTEIGIARYLLIKRGNVKKHHVMAES